MGLDVDGVGRGLAVHEGDVDGESDAEHNAASAAELGVGLADADKELLALALEVQDAFQEDNVFAVEFYAGDVHLQAVVTAGEADVEGVHWIYVPALEGCAIGMA